ncbi:hypothetical protein F018LOC_03053 [Pectobacterium versatile]|nr:hypothetical protein F018LOC_03053 [Pectobacterium versatile]
MFVVSGARFLAVATSDNLVLMRTWGHSGTHLYSSASENAAGRYSALAASAAADCH